MAAEDFIICNEGIKVSGNRMLETLSNDRGFEVFNTDKISNTVCEFRDMNSDRETFFKSKRYKIEKAIYEVEKDGSKCEFGKEREGSYVMSVIKDSGENIILETSDNCKEVFFGGSYDRDLLHFATWMAFSLAVLPKKIVSLHASSIIYQGRAVLFLGESGTGKSTHSRLWQENIPEVRLLNDDSPFIRADGSEVVAFGSPWSGKTHCYINESFPVAACVRLSQAPYNEIRRLDTLKAFGALHPSCPPAFAYDDYLYDFVSDFLSNLLSKIPVFHMEALPDSDAVETVFKAVFE